MKEVRKTLTQAVLSILLICSVAAHKAYPQNRGKQDAIQPVQPLTVFDGNGKRVGNVLGFFVENLSTVRGGDATVALRAGGELVILYVKPNRFTGKEHGFTQESTSLYFESSNCTGQAYTSTPGLTPPPALVGPHVLHGTKLYALDGPPKSIVLGSIGSISSCDPVSAETVKQPLRFLTDLVDQFQPPFTLR